MSFSFYPWDNGKKPYFVNPEGFEWYADVELTKYAQNENLQGITLPDIYVFWVRKGEDVKHVILNSKLNQVVYEGGIEDIGVRIDIMKADTLFSKDEDDTIELGKDKEQPI